MGLVLLLPQPSRDAVRFRQAPHEAGRATVGDLRLEGALRQLLLLAALPLLLLLGEAHLPNCDVIALVEPEAALDKFLVLCLLLLLLLHDARQVGVRVLQDAQPALNIGVGLRFLDVRHEGSLGPLDPLGKLLGTGLAAPLVPDAHLLPTSRGLLLGELGDAGPEGAFRRQVFQVRGRSGHRCTESAAIAVGLRTGACGSNTAAFC
mmetsp:Transcript_6170/g.17377  ORF Transcript_6170/g.17377 Transcript_6170/m.17377 type:complete len:206 (-) Transcript_6170:853-1470(-)